MDTTALKIVIDTNVFIAIIGKSSPHRWIFDKILSGKFQLCISNDILFEYQEILTVKTTKEISQNVTDFLVIHPSVSTIDVYYKWNLITADFDDNKFIDCAISANAHCIVSNDKHFQEVNKIDFPKVLIMTLSEFEKGFKQTIDE